jgi:hypothetical protein
MNSLKDFGPVFAGGSFFAPAAALVSAMATGGKGLWAFTRPVIMTQRLMIARFFFILFNYCFLKTSPKYILFGVIFLLIIYLLKKNVLKIVSINNLLIL